MVTKDKLYLHEEIMLLALRDKEGTIAAGPTYQYAIGAAVLAELLLSERIVVDQSIRRSLSTLSVLRLSGNLCWMIVSKRLSQLRDVPHFKHGSLGLPLSRTSNTS